MTEQKDIKETEYRRQKGTTSTPSRRRNKKNAEVTFYHFSHPYYFNFYHCVYYPSV